MGPLSVSVVPSTYNYYDPTVSAIAATDRLSGFDSGEGALKTATTSKEGSRHANYTLKPSPRIYWRASLVPAAAVIPAGDS